MQKQKDLEISRVLLWVSMSSERNSQMLVSLGRRSNYHWYWVSVLITWHSSKDTATHIGSKRPSIISQSWIILLLLSIKTRNIFGSWEMETWTQALMGEPLAGASNLGILEDLRRKKLGKNSQRMEDFCLELQVNNYLRFLISLKVYTWAIYWLSTCNLH